MNVDRILERVVAPVAMLAAALFILWAGLVSA